ncbi:Hypothetical_protein [Hexamita inflata]|uniref:Hypothetical_protein n=1 Tax=Hexamita inflata TaxID=28002 RepID=A0ABP1GF41_9EUKA
MKQLRQVVKPKHIKVEKQISSSKNIIIVYDIDHKQQQNQFSFQYSKISILFRGYRDSAHSRHEAAHATTLAAELLIPPTNVFTATYLSTAQKTLFHDRGLFFKIVIQLWEVELLFLVYYVSNYILKYFATSNADDKFQYIISSWRLFMNYSLTQEGQKYDFDRIRPQSTIQSRYLIFQKGKIEITTCIKRTAMTKINAVEDVQGRSTNSLNKLRQF